MTAVRVHTIWQCGRKYQKIITISKTKLSAKFGMWFPISKVHFFVCLTLSVPLALQIYGLSDFKYSMVMR